jgi:transposase
MSKARLVITAVILEKRPVTEVATTYGVARSWIYELLARYRAEGETAFEPRSRRPKHSPKATPPETIDLVLRIRKELHEAGHDAGAYTLRWHLEQHDQVTLSRATVHRIVIRAGAVTPAPKKRPKSSYIRFEAAIPNECWQSDFTHYRLTHRDADNTTRPGPEVEIITWLDDCTRYALHLSAQASRDFEWRSESRNRCPARLWRTVSGTGRAVRLCRPRLLAPCIVPLPTSRTYGEPAAAMRDSSRREALWNCCSSSGLNASITRARTVATCAGALATSFA